MTGEEFLKANHYELKHTNKVGYWVDGACGYLVTGYYDDKEQCLDVARLKIMASWRDGSKPSWKFTQFRLITE